MRDEDLREEFAAWLRPVRDAGRRTEAQRGEHFSLDSASGRRNHGRIQISNATLPHGVVRVLDSGDGGNHEDSSVLEASST